MLTLMTTVVLVLCIVSVRPGRKGRQGISRPLGTVELLTIQSLMHVPQCAADKHCRSACRMVCAESSQGLGDETDHAASLIAFGCCFETPLIEKQVLSRGARETQLLQVGEAESSSASRRLLSSRSDDELHDQHSLQADFEELQRQEEALKRRLAVLPLRSALPSLKVARGGGVTNLFRSQFSTWSPASSTQALRGGAKKVRKGGGGAASPGFARHNHHHGSSLIDMDGSRGGEFGWDRTHHGWMRIDEADQDGWRRSSHTRPSMASDEDPFGTESHHFHKRGNHSWTRHGRFCVGNDCPSEMEGYKRLGKFHHFLDNTDRFGMPFGYDDGAPLNGSEANATSNATSLGADEDEPLDLDDKRLPGDLWGWDPLWEGLPCALGEKHDACDRQLNAWHDQYEWRSGDDCVAGAAAAAANGSAAGAGAAAAAAANGSAAGGNGSAAAPVAPGGGGAGAGGAGGGRQCLISARLEREYGYDVARGLADADAVEKGLLADRPTDETIRHFLGSSEFDRFDPCSTTF